MKPFPRRGDSPTLRRGIPMALFLWTAVAAGLALAAPARAATYYVDPSGSGAGGTTWATAFTTVQAGLAAAVQSGDTVEISAGTYTENLATVHAGVTVQGSTASGHSGTVTIKGSNGQVALSVNHQTTWRRITVDASANTNDGVYAVVIESAAAATAFDQCVIGPGRRLLNIKAGTAFTRCTISDARVSGTSPVVYINAGTGDVSFSYCLLSDAGYGYIHAQTADRVDFNNCLLAGFGGSVLYVHPTAVIPSGIFWTNCLALANGVRSNGIIQNDSATVAVTLTKGLVQPRTPFNLSGVKYTGNVTESGALSGSPLLTHGRRKALINIGIDDEVSIDMWRDVATECDRYGFKTTLALNTAAVQSGDWPILQGLVNNGHEVASHTAHHVYLADLGLFSIRYIGAGSAATLTIDRSVSPPLLTTSVTGAPADNVTLSLGTSQTVADVKAYFDTLSTKYICTLVTVSGTSYDSGRWLSQDAQAVAGADIKSAARLVSADRDAAKHDELTVPKQLIEANLHNASGGSYSCDAFVYPYEGVNDAAIADVHAAGYKVARSNADGFFAMGSPDGYNLLNILCTEPHLIFGTTWTEAELRNMVSAVLEWTKFTGVAISLFSHAQPEEFTFAQWQTLLGIMAEDPDVSVVTLRQIYDYVSANGQTSDGGITYVRTAAWPAVANYRPRTGSPLIDAGQPYGTAMTDFGGAVVPAGTIPSVGLYQTSQSSSGGGVLPAIYGLLLLQ